MHRWRDVFVSPTYILSSCLHRYFAFPASKRRAFHPFCLDCHPTLSLPLSKKQSGNLGVKGLGRASCACRCLRDTVADERLWTALWEGPLPYGFPSGGKAAHAALWLLAKGEVEQVGMLLFDVIARARKLSCGFFTFLGTLLRCQSTAEGPNSRSVFRLVLVPTLGRIVCVKREGLLRGRCRS